MDAGEYACEAEIVIPLDTPTLLMQEIAEKVAVATMIRDTPGIERCYIVEADVTGPTKVQTDGINFTGVWAHSDLIDVDNITTNDVGSTLRMYGVEAARATLMREVRAVFGAYGIGVDPRHLGLIADFMTHMVAHLALPACCLLHYTIITTMCLCLCLCLSMIHKQAMLPCLHAERLL